MLFPMRGAKGRHRGSSPAALQLGGTLPLKTPSLVLCKSNVAFWKGQRQRQRSSKSIPKQRASSKQLARKLDVCKLKLHLVLQLITWAEMDLHIITSEYEILSILLPAHNPAPGLHTLSSFDHASACCPSAPVMIFLWWKRSVVTTLFGYHSPVCSPPPPRHTLWAALHSHNLRWTCCPLVWGDCIWESPLWTLAHAALAFLQTFAVQSFQSWTESTSTSWARNNDDYDWVGFFFLFFLPPL